MPRPPRYFLSGIPLHVIQRGNNRQPCFFRERDYAIYLDKLREYSIKFGVLVHGYALMTNHVHLLTPQHSEGPSELLQALGRYFVRLINSAYSRTGTLWEGRYKSSLVDSDAYLLTVSRYIELNPVRAGIVKHPAEYVWSSYQMNAMGKKIGLVTPHALYTTLGSTDEARQRAYRALFDSEIPNATIEEIRTAANKTWVLGGNGFKQQIEQQLDYEIPPFAHGGDRKSVAFGDGRIKLL